MKSDLPQAPPIMSTRPPETRASAPSASATPIATRPGVALHAKPGRSLLLGALLAGGVSTLLGGCGTTAVLNRGPADCSKLLPDDYRKPVAGAPLPGGLEVGDWISFGDAQTGKLDQANGHTKSAVEIVEKCEARDREAAKQLTRKKFLGLF